MRRRKALSLFMLDTRSRRPGRTEPPMWAIGEATWRLDRYRSTAEGPEIIGSGWPMVSRLSGRPLNRNGDFGLLGNAAAGRTMP